MSIRFANANLFRSIINNDIEKLDDAILFLGPKVHEVKVWMDLTAIEYAAKLGHFQQVQTLLNALDKCSKKEFISDRVLSVFKQAYSDTNFNFLQTLMEKYPDTFKDSKFSFSLVQENVVASLSAIVLKNQSVLPRILEQCVKQGNRECFLIWHENIPADGGHQNENLKNDYTDYRTPPKIDSLARAILIGDISQFSRLLQESFKESKDLSTRSRYVDRHNSHEVSSVFTNCRYGYIVHRIASLVIRTDDLDFFKILIIPANMSNLKTESYHMSNASKKDDMLEALFSIAVEVEAVKIIHFLIGKIRSGDVLSVEVGAVDWDRIYFTQLIHGRVKSAAAISSLRTLTDRKKISRRTQRDHLISDVFPLIIQQRQATVALLERLVTELEQFIRQLPDSDTVWEKLLAILCEMPLENKRPDLVRPFRKYGIQYSDAHIILKMNDKYRMSYYHRDQSFPWDERTDDDDEEFTDEADQDPYRDKLHIPIYPPTDVYLAQLSAFYLGERKQVMKLNYYLKFTEEGRAVITECTVQSGRRPPFASESTLHHEETKNFLDELERTRRSTLTLQKLCRLTIRRTTRDATIRRLSLAIISLYTDNYLPKTLVKYLLYREDHLARPLYHQLVDFNGREKLSYIEKPRPEREVHDYYLDDEQEDYDDDDDDDDDDYYYSYYNDGPFEFNYDSDRYW